MGRREERIITREENHKIGMYLLDIDIMTLIRGAKRLMR